MKLFEIIAHRYFRKIKTRHFYDHSRPDTTM